MHHGNFIWINLGHNKKHLTGLWVSKTPKAVNNIDLEFPVPSVWQNKITPPALPKSIYYSQHDYPLIIRWYFLFSLNSSLPPCVFVSYFVSQKCVVGTGCACLFLFLCRCCEKELGKERYVGHKNIPITQYWGGGISTAARSDSSLLWIHVLLCMTVLSPKAWLSDTKSKRARQIARERDLRKETLAQIGNAKWAIEQGRGGVKTGSFTTG